MTSGERTAVRLNAQRVLGARVGTTIGQLALLAVIERLYGVAELAIFAVGWAAAGILSNVLDGGSGLWAAQHIGGGRPRPSIWLAKTPNVVLAASLAAGASQLGWLGGASSAAVVLAAIAIAGAKYLRGVLWGGDRYGIEARVAVVETWAGVAAVGLSGLVGVGNVVSPLMAFAACSLGGNGFRLLASRSVRVSGRLGVVALLRETWSYSGQAVVTSAQTQADVLILGALLPVGAPEVAAYGVALRFYYAVGMPLEAAGGALLTSIARRRNVDWGFLHRTFAWLTPVSVVAFVGALGATVLGLFGGGVADAVLPIGLALLLGIPFRSATYLLGNAATALGGQRERFVVSAFGVGAMVALDMVLIPIGGAVGAAAALVMADLILSVGYGKVVRRHDRSSTP